MKLLIRKQKILVAALARAPLNVRNFSIVLENNNLSLRGLGALKYMPVKVKSVCSFYFFVNHIVSFVESHFVRNAKNLRFMVLNDMNRIPSFIIRSEEGSPVEILSG